MHVQTQLPIIPVRADNGWWWGEVSSGEVSGLLLVISREKKRNSIEILSGFIQYIHPKCTMCLHQNKKKDCLYTQ